MDNTSVTALTMTAYAVMDNYKYVYLTMFFLLYVIIISTSVLLIAVIYQQKSLHQPMNLHTCSLAINGIYGGTALLPATMSVLVSGTHEISLKWCLTQIYFLHTYAGVEFFILSVMGYDRYVAICFPLHYHSSMSFSKTCKLVVLSWVYPWLLFIVYFSLTIQLKFCERLIHKLYCVNFELVKNSCTNTSYISLFGLVLIMFFIVPQLLMILFSYVQILRVCKQLSKESQVKALKTCIPHLLSVANYTFGGLFEIIQSRFDMSLLAHETRIFLSLYYIIMPPIVNPALYGLGTKAIRDHVIKLFFRSKRLEPS